ncbi:hypothetical protein NKI77_01605 [Mesorhizobium opportunistum]|uniref:Uncharacterized protein n=1 Tax=Mesorhizobium opportunistum TaxID=593909 RepID=A0ABV1YF68_9HYPH|nr:hypothetical protein [Mesorhizobium sp.]
MAQPPLPLETMDDEMFDRIANVNMRSIYNGARAVVPHFKSIKAIELAPRAFLRAGSGLECQGTFVGAFSTIIAAR